MQIWVTTCLGASQRKGSRASSVTIQGDIVVPDIHILHKVNVSFAVITRFTHL